MDKIGKGKMLIPMNRMLLRKKTRMNMGMSKLKMIVMTLKRRVESQRKRKR